LLEKTSITKPWRREGKKKDERAYPSTRKSGLARMITIIRVKKRNFGTNDLSNSTPLVKKRKKREVGLEKVSIFSGEGKSWMGEDLKDISEKSNEEESDDQGAGIEKLELRTTTRGTSVLGGNRIKNGNEERN